MHPLCFYASLSALSGFRILSLHFYPQLGRMADLNLVVCPMEPKLLAKAIVEELEELQATDIKDIDVTGKTSVADHFIVCTGRSNRHVKAVAEKVIGKLKALGHSHISTSGLTQGDWALIDCGDAILHVMTSEVRAFYNIEGLWLPEQTSDTPSERTN